MSDTPKEDRATHINVGCLNSVLQAVKAKAVSEGKSLTRLINDWFTEYLIGDKK